MLRSDNGTEIRNANTKELLEKLGVFHSNKSSAYTPEQNGRIEREMLSMLLNQQGQQYMEEI